MSSRLDRVGDWEEQARKAVYHATVLASGAGVTRQQLERYFRKRWGVVPHRWIEQVRINDSLRLLHQGRLIKEIAHELGYRNATHFSRAFRRVQGTSPSSELPPSTDLRAVPNGQNVPKWSGMFQNGPSSFLMEKGYVTNRSAITKVRP